jgi:hypothetical protein
MQVKAKTKILITYCRNFFLETAHGFQQAFAKIGFTSVDVIGTFNYTRYLEIIHQHQQTAEHYPILQLVIGPLVVPTIADYILLHTENVWLGYIIHTDSYDALMDNARAIFTYSPVLMEHMEGTYQMPLYSVPTYFDARTVTDELSGEKRVERYKKYPEISELEPEETQELYDVCVVYQIGSLRRQTVTEMLLNMTQERNLTFLVPSLHEEIDPHDIYTKEWLALQCKVVLNFHTDPSTVLETHRINHLFSLGKCVVSEESPIDPYLDRQYEDSMKFVPVHNVQALVETAMELLQDPVLLRGCEVRARQKYEEIMDRVDVLDVAMSDVLENENLQSLYF